MIVLHDHPDIRSLRVAACDLNGIARGKRMPRRFAEKAETEGTRFPLSVLNLDIWGDDIEDSPLVFESGDPDGIALPTERGFLPMPWLPTPTALLPVWMHREDGTAFDGDPRHALARVLARFEARGLTAVVGTELEFYLVDDNGPELRIPPSPRSGKRRPGGEILSLRMLDAFDSFFTEVYDGCDAMDIPAETAVSESGLGQFEMTLSHAAAMKAADDAWLFKLLIRGLARNHGFAAAFMAKPYPEYSGNGMHVHVSVLDREGRNIFDDGTPRGTPALSHAVAGCLAAMPASALIFYPHASSYDRLVPGAHAPTAAAWGYENRTVALRIPAGSPRARRIEHRVAGGDVNPYLMLAAILGSILTGLEDEAPPPDPITGNAYTQDLPQLPRDWSGAMAAFESSEVMPRILPRGLMANLLATKRQEMRHIVDMTAEEREALYLDTV